VRISVNIIKVIELIGMKAEVNIPGIARTETHTKI